MAIAIIGDLNICIMPIYQGFETDIILIVERITAFILPLTLAYDTCLDPDILHVQ